MTDSTAGNDAPDETAARIAAIRRSPSYVLAEQDVTLLARPQLRPMRLQLEFLKPELALEQAGVRSTVVVFGSTQIAEPARAAERVAGIRQALAERPDDARLQRELARAERLAALAPYYDAAREFARLVSTSCRSNGNEQFVIVTGGGPGIMEAANRGAFDAGAVSVGLNITLPAEQLPNPYITPELCFQFRYFAMRKMHFLLRAKALVVFPGGFGTMDELLDALTLRQTNRMQAIPIVMFGRRHWEQVLNLRLLADEGLIGDDDLELVSYAETPAEAWQRIVEFFPTT